MHGTNLSAHFLTVLTNVPIIPVAQRICCFRTNTFIKRDDIDCCDHYDNHDKIKEMKNSIILES